MTEEAMNEGREADLTPDDLAMIPPALADEGKSEEDLWDEIQQERSGGKAEIEPDAKPDEAEVEDEAPVEAKAGAPNDAPKEADPWAQVPEALRRQYEETRAERDELKHRDSSARGRISALQKRINELTASLADADEQDDDEPPIAERLAGVQNDYPDVAKPLVEALTTVEQRQRMAEARERERALRSRNELAEAQKALSVEVQRETTLLAREHPDYADMINRYRPQFLTWVEDQPKAVREAVARNADYIADAKEASAIISRFKAYVNGGAAEAPRVVPQPAQTPKQSKALDPRRERQLSATASPSGSPRRPVRSGIPEDGDPEDIWNAILDEKRRKRAS